MLVVTKVLLGEKYKISHWNTEPRGSSGVSGKGDSFHNEDSGIEGNPPMRGITINRKCICQNMD